MAKTPPKPIIVQALHEPESVTIFRISAEHRTRRMIVVTAGIVVSLGIIAWMVVRISEKPWWAALFSTVGGAIAIILGGQYGLFRYLMMRLRRYTVLNQDRVKNLEAERDPSRSSTGLRKDGTNPPEDPI